MTLRETFYIIIIKPRVNNLFIRNVFSNVGFKNFMSIICYKKFVKKILHELYVIKKGVIKFHLNSFF